MDPSTIQSLLVQQLGSKAGQPGAVGGGAAGPQMQGQTSGANLMAQFAQKAMLMKALQSQQQNQQQGVANGMLPGTNAQISNDPAMQALQQPPQLPMDPTMLQQLQQPPQVMPPGGVPGQ
jgi:hypothetical protein